MVSVYKNVDVEIDVDIGDFSTEDLCDEIETRGMKVLEKEELTLDQHTEGAIRNLKDDFINWYQFGMKNENFENRLKEFFKETIDEYIP